MCCACIKQILYCSKVISLPFSFLQMMKTSLVTSATWIVMIVRTAPKNVNEWMKMATTVKVALEGQRSASLEGQGRLSHTNN